MAKLGAPLVGLFLVVNEGDDAWLMKIELKREEPGEINKDDGS